MNRAQLVNRLYHLVGLVESKDEEQYDFLKNRKMSEITNCICSIADDFQEAIDRTRNISAETYGLNEQ